MCEVLHGVATTTEAVRRAKQHSQASLRALAKRHGINPKTVAKWKRQTSPDQARGRDANEDEGQVLSDRLLSH
jgi:transposase-like protein